MRHEYSPDIKPPMPHGSKMVIGGNSLKLNLPPDNLVLIKEILGMLIEIFRILP
jgi:hypothetical protein